MGRPRRRLAASSRRARFEDRPQSAAILDVPLLLSDGLAGLPADKWPPLESLTSCKCCDRRRSGRETPRSHR